MNQSLFSRVRIIRILNAIGFQIGWWACVLSVGYDLEIYAITLCALLISLHLYVIKKPWPDLKLAWIMLAWGIVMDSLMQYLKVINFLGYSFGPLSPFWLWAIWLIFAMTLNWSLSFLKDIRWFYSALLGVVFGPLSYYSGAKLGGATFEPTYTNFLLFAVFWGISMPCLVLIAKKIFNSETRENE